MCILSCLSTYTSDCDCFHVHPAVKYACLFPLATHLYSLLLIFPLVVTVRYEREWYSVEEENGRVTLVLVLDRAVPFRVTVIVNTLDLVNRSIGDAATGELLEF